MRDTKHKIIRIEYLGPHYKYPGLSSKSFTVSPAPFPSRIFSFNKGKNDNCKSKSK